MSPKPVIKNCFEQFKFIYNLYSIEIVVSLFKQVMGIGKNKKLKFFSFTTLKKEN